MEWSSLEVVRVACQQWWLDVVGVGCRESWPSNCSLKLVSQTMSRVHFSTHLISSPHLNISLDFPLSHYLISHPPLPSSYTKFSSTPNIPKIYLSYEIFPLPKRRSSNRCIGVYVTFFKNSEKWRRNGEEYKWWNEEVEERSEEEKKWCRFRERRETEREERRERMKLLENLRYYSKYFWSYHIFINTFKNYNIISIFSMLSILKYHIFAQPNNPSIYSKKSTLLSYLYGYKSIVHLSWDIFMSKA